jgi:hypothetical protein
VRFKLADKRGALIDMGKHLGMFRDQAEPLAFDPNESIEDIRDELLRDMAEAGLVKLLPAPQPEPAPPAGVANRKAEDEAQRQGSPAATAEGAQGQAGAIAGRLGRRIVFNEQYRPGWRRALSRPGSPAPEGA